MKNSKADISRKAPIPKPRLSHRPTSPESTTSPVVGIGASAGGLEAFTELLRYLPEKSGMAYLLVQHLDPTHSSVSGASLRPRKS
jgi:two-component system, chemotaxis family, CheB/CheR fusion protein